MIRHREERAREVLAATVTLMRWWGGFSPLVLLTLAMLLSVASAQPNPSPNSTNNNYSHNRSEGDVRPLPRESVEPHGQKPHEPDQVAQTHATPMESAGNKPDRGCVGDQNEGELTVKVDSGVPVKRDYIDGLSLFLNFALLLFIAWQLNILGQAYVADHRPRLVIRHIALTTNPTELFDVDDTGNVRFARAEFAFVIGNRGATKSKIIERNITLKQLGAVDNLKDVLQALRQRAMPLPEMDKEMGRPLYDLTGTAIDRFKLRPDEERMLKMSVVSQSIHEAVNMHLSLVAPEGAKHLRFFALGYFRYKDRTGRKYTTAFCRLYDRDTARFIPVNDRRYEYRT